MRRRHARLDRARAIASSLYEWLSQRDFNADNAARGSLGTGSNGTEIRDLEHRVSVRIRGAARQKHCLGVRSRRSRSPRV